MRERKRTVPLRRRLALLFPRATVLLAERVVGDAAVVDVVPARVVVATVVARRLRAAELPASRCCKR